MQKRPIRRFAAFAVFAALLSARSPFPARAAEAAAGPFGAWRAEDILGGGVIDRLQTTIEIRADGEAAGFGGCNRFHARAIVSGEAIAFGPAAATRKMCSPAIMNQEAKFFRALEGVRGWSRDDGRRKLSLRDAEARELILFSAAD